MLRNGGMVRFGWSFDKKCNIKDPRTNFIGTVVNIDGAYISVRMKLGKDRIAFELYPNEVIKLEKKYAKNLVQSISHRCSEDSQ